MWGRTWGGAREGMGYVAAGDGEEEGEDDGRGQSFNILSLGPSSSVASGARTTFAMIP